jgi:hypothetical protein
LLEEAGLLLHNASAHPSENVKKSDAKLFVKCLPPNVTALIQPMDCHNEKSSQEKSSVETVDEGNDLRMFWKKLCLYEVSYTWNMVKQTAISKTGKKIYFQITKLMTAWDLRRKTF